MEIEESGVEIELKLSKDRRLAVIKVSSDTAMNSMDLAWALEWYITELMKYDAAEREKPKRLI